MIIPVTALGILSSLLMPEVRNEVSELLFPTVPTRIPVGEMMLRVNKEGKVDGMVLS